MSNLFSGLKSTRTCVEINNLDLKTFSASGQHTNFQPVRKWSTRNVWSLRDFLKLQHYWLTIYLTLLSSSPVSHVKKR